jgi:hypothetical protein
MDQRWVRYAVGNEEDPGNWAQKEREGWRPRDPKTLQKKHQSAARIDRGDFAGFIGFRGTVLCERPLQISEKFRQANRAKIDTNTATIERELAAQAVPGAPIMQDRVSKRVREVKVADNE